jgi:hypothetical protein
MVAAALLLGGLHARGAADYLIRFTEDDIGALPRAFEVPAQDGMAHAFWSIVHEPTSPEEFALEQASREVPDDAHPMAVYKPASLKNLDVRLHFKIVSGHMKNAGIALRYQDPANYYVVVASALEQRVDLFRAVNGRLRRIGGMEAHVALEDWQEVRVIAQDQRVTVLFNGMSSFRALDPTFNDSGRVALWTEDDNVTRFDRLTIKALPE